MELDKPLYDPIAEQFEKHAENSSYNALYDRPAMLELMGDVEGQWVLDAGCGPGFYVEELLNRGANVVGLDQSPKMVDIASKRLGERAEVLCHDLSEPFNFIGTETYDKILLALVLHYLDDRVSMLKELHRVLKPGGRLYVSTHHPTNDWLPLGGSYFDPQLVEETWKQDWHMRYWHLPLGATCDEFAAAGFLIERVVEPLPQPEMEATDPKHFAELSALPGFINFQLLKPGAETPKEL